MLSSRCGHPDAIMRPVHVFVGNDYDFIGVNSGCRLGL
jgi:hypothetical protein